MIYLISNVEHNNIGDLAIHIATTFFFKDNKLEYKVINRLNYKDFEINDNDILVLRGGGFLGIYENPDEIFAVNFIHKYRKNKIIFLPSSFFEINSSLIEKIKDISCIIFSRDNTSYDNYKRYFNNAKIYKSYDMALYLNLPKLNTIETDKIYFYKRNDIETLENISVPNCLIKSRILPESKEIHTDINEIYNVLMLFLNDLNTASFIISDSLHVCIFAFLLNKKCLALDNKYGKISSTLNSYLHSVLLYNKNLGFDFNKYTFTNQHIKFNYENLIKELKDQ